MKCPLTSKCYNKELLAREGSMSFIIWVCEKGIISLISQPNAALEMWNNLYN